MRVLVIGAGAREHTFCWSLAQGLPPGSVLCAPGNAGIARQAACHPVDATDAGAVLALIEREHIDLTVVGPELPLTHGVANRLLVAGKLVCGPTCEAAALEASKAFSKDLMVRHGVHTARHEVVESLDQAL